MLPMAWLDALIGLGIGILLGAAGAAWLGLLKRNRLETDLHNACGRVELLEEERRSRVADEGRLKDTLGGLGAGALRANNQQFLDLARKTFDAVITEARGDVEQRKQAIDSMIKPINALLEKHNTAVTEIEKRRAVAYRGLEEQIKAIAASHEKLGLETSKLVAALHRPEQRGRWGEMQLRNAVELAGMTAHCDFTEQPQTDDPDSRDRPDMIVHLPGDGVIIVDSKVAIDAYLDSLPPEADRQAALQRHAEQVETHVRKLAAKRYWKQFERTPKLVVMFMPLESALTAALEIKPDLHAAAMQDHVLIATPILVVALLRAIAYGWQQEDIAANAREIAMVGSELYERVKTFVGHFEDVGARLSKAGDCYNKAVGSLEGRVLPSARKLKELHATTQPAIGKPALVEIEPRPITAPELKPAGNS